MSLSETGMSEHRPPRERKRQEAFETMPMLIADCGSKKVSEDSGVSDGPARLSPLPSSVHADGNMVHSYKSATRD